MALKNLGNKLPISIKNEGKYRSVYYNDSPLAYVNPDWCSFVPERVSTRLMSSQGNQTKVTMIGSLVVVNFNFKLSSVPSEAFDVYSGLPMMEYNDSTEKNFNLSAGNGKYIKCSYNGYGRITIWYSTNSGWELPKADTWYSGIYCYVRRSDATWEEDS